MSGDFNASVVISTAESEKGLRNVDTAAKDLDKTLRNLDGALKANQGNLDQVAKSMSTIVSANAALIRSDRERARATTEAARAEGVMVVNEGKRAKTANEVAIAEAKVARIRQGTVASGLGSAATSTRRDAESRARMYNAAAITTQRLATETERTTGATYRASAAQTQLEGATARTELSQLRLANAQTKAASSALSLNDNLSNSRYLLYDVGQTYTVISAALLAIPVATTQVAIAYERDFAQVMRTNDSLKGSSGLTDLRQELKTLATEIPLTFGEFANISTIAGQLGIAGEDVGAFTETVARFGAASNVSLDEASTAFGRLKQSFDPLNKQSDFFNKIGSAIAYVGVKSAATETEIIAVTNQIAAAGAQFGFTAQDVVGLSGALASVRIRPELARGAFQRIMLGLSRAADEGGASFDKFAKYTGVAGDAAQQLLKNDPSQFFYKYIGGIKQAIAETGSVSGVLDDVGAKNVFDKQFILGLANGYKTFGDSLGYASDSFNKGTFLNESTQGVFETMDAKLKRIGNSFKNLADTLAKGTLGDGGGLKTIADAVLNISTATDRLARSAPGVTGVINAFLALGTAVGILLAFKATQAFVLAGIVGFQQVLGKGTLAAGLTAKGILQQVAVTMLMAKGASQQSAQALVAQAGAFKAMGVAAQTSNAQVKAGVLGGIGGVSNAAPVATSRIAALTGGLKGLGSGALALVGGPIGILIGAAAMIGTTMLMSSEQVSQAADEMSRAMANGADAGQRAAAEALNKIKVAWTDGIAFGNLDKSLTEIARDAGVPFDKLAAAALKGKDAGKEVVKVLDEVARNKGFKDLQDLNNNSPMGQNNAGQLNFIKNKVTELGEKSASSAANIKDVEKATGDAGKAAEGAVPGMKGIGDEIGNAGDEAETAADKIDKLIKQIFGIANAEAATQSALQSLGESIATSTDFSGNSEGGRDNLKNYQDALASAAQEQQNLIENTGKSYQQASADYTAFVDGLTQELAARGVNPDQVALVAQQAKDGVASIFGAGVNLPVTTDPAQAQAEGAKAAAVIQTGAQAVQAYVSVNADTTAADMDLGILAKNLSVITGYPYEVVMDALTNPAHEKSTELYNLITSITDKTYVAPVNVDTSAAQANISNFAYYANQQLQSIQAAYQNVLTQASSGSGFFKGAANSILGKGYNGDGKQTYFGPQQTIAQVAAPKQQAAVPTGNSNLGGLADGYDKVRDAAQKAGDAGKQAGEDMADGISDATRAANDYAQRLKTGLTSAFESQYGLTKATDDYYTALNTITKKRDDELKQLDDLIAKQKELNNERNDELINARKAGIEKNISIKYGEVDRAADYANQEQKALDAAAAKQKDIEANKSQADSLQAGIGNFEGYSQAAIDNREALRGLESKMLDMVSAYAATGASQEQVRAYAQRLTAQFQNDAGQVWQNRVQIVNLTGDMGRYIAVVNSVPLVKPTKVTADTAGAMGQISGFNGAVDWATRPRTVVVQADTSQYVRDWMQANVTVRNDYLNNLPSRGPGGTNAGIPLGMYRGGQVPGFAGGGQIPGNAPSDPSVDNKLASVDGKGLIRVRSKEFIMSQPAVDYWGLDMMNAMNSMKMPRFNSGGSVGGGNGSGSTSSGPVLVELTAENLAAILRLADRPIDLWAGVEKLASTVAQGNVILASKGVI